MLEQLGIKKEIIELSVKIENELQEVFKNIDKIKETAEKIEKLDNQIKNEFNWQCPKCNKYFK